jgi:hypothetical protein
VTVYLQIRLFRLWSYRLAAERTDRNQRLSNAAPQTRIVSVARIRLDPGNLSELSKGHFATTFPSSSPTTSASQYGLRKSQQRTVALFDIANVSDLDSEARAFFVDAASFSKAGRRRAD